MRIDRLALPSYRNLTDFEVDFDDTSNRQVIVGRNGVGKSNLLEALTQIFRDLDLEEDSGFEYRIEYLCNEHFVRIDCSRPIAEHSDATKPMCVSFKRKYSIAPEHPGPRELRPYEQIPEVEFYRRNRPVGQQPNPKRLLPLYVFGYYSGIISRFSTIFEKHEERYFKEQIAGEEAPLRPIFQAKPTHSQFALLAFYATRDSDAQKFLEEEFRILGFDSALFSLREPYWKQSKPARNRRNVGDPRFWF